MDYKRIKVSLLSAGDNIIFNGKVCQVVEKISPLSIKIREFKKKKVARREFADKWHTIQDDIEVDKVMI